MMNELTQEKTDIVLAMEKHLKNDILKNAQWKLWDNNFINKQIERRNKDETFTLKDHIRAMVYSMLSSGASWDRISKDIDPDTKGIISVDKVFCDYDTEQLLSYTPEQLKEAVKDIGCGTLSTRKQMKALLSANIPKLLKLEKEYGTVDTYYQKFIELDSTLKTLVTALSSLESKDKLVQMDIALVCEYLRNVGYDIPKPDRHLCRILGSDYLAFSNEQTVPPFEVFDIVVKLAEMTGKCNAEVDYILWSYCADGYGEICRKDKPKCNLCIAINDCKQLM